MLQANINGTMLEYLCDGPEVGEVVMLSNSLASDHSMWRYQVPCLVEAGYRVLRYDNRGHGRSASPPGPYSVEMLAGDALELMDHLGLEKVHFCGLSLGGMTGQTLGAFHGDRLASLTLCATGSYMPPPELWEERITTARSSGIEPLADATIDRWFTKAGQERLRGDVEEVRRTIVTTSIEGYCGCCAAIRDMDLREAIRNITTRTMIMVGEEDQGTPVSAAEFIHERIASSSLKVIPGAAHFLNMEQAGIFNATLLDFLDTGRAGQT